MPVKEGTGAAAVELVWEKKMLKKMLKYAWESADSLLEDAKIKHDITLLAKSNGSCQKAKKKKRSRGGGCEEGNQS